MATKNFSQSLVKKLNSACEVIKAAGKCTEACAEIGWCKRAWDIAQGREDAPNAQ